MIAHLLRRVGLGLAAAAVIATSAAIIVAALAFALFALVRPQFGPAGAAATVAGAAAALLLIVGLALTMAAGRSRPAPVVPRGRDPVERVVNFIKDKPVTAVAAAVAAGFLAIRNPGYLGAAVRSFLEGKPPPTDGRRKRG